MKRPKGLLAFACTLIAAAGALLQLPVVSGAQLFLGEEPQPLLVHLRSPDDPGPAPGRGVEKPVALLALKRDGRPDAQIQELSREHRMPFWELKAHLAAICRGARDLRGSFLPRLPEGDERLPDDGPARTRAAAALLGQYRDETGSLYGALLAWGAGTPRARRVASAGDIRLLLSALRAHMLASHRREAREILCTVLGLAAAANARWPVEDRTLRRDGAGALLAAAEGQGVHAPMSGRVVWAGDDGARGECLVLSHACDLTTEFCRLAELRARTGALVQRGDLLGTAESQRPWFGLLLGSRYLDPQVLLDE